MSYHERNLPHCYPSGAALFLTWCLYGSGPHGCRDDLSMPTQNVTPGQLFARTDRLLDTATNGSRWLEDPRIAALVADALEQGEKEYQLYELFARVIMPNHVHAVLRPSQQLPVIMRWLKGSTAHSANRILGRSGNRFWQSETYDHCIRTTQELNRVIRYVELNPVRAGLARDIEAFAWSSAAAGRRPTLHSA